MTNTSPQNTDSYFFDELSRLNNELVSMQRELTRKNVELAELNTIKNQFLGMAAHDLRNPLSYIINFCDFIEEERTHLSIDQTGYISQIKSLSAFMHNLVNDLLEISAIESGVINLMLESVDLVSLVTDNLRLNKILADKKRIKIQFDSNLNSLSLSLDKGKIEQVITNLISNAVKYSMPDSNVSVSLNKIGSDAIITVRDNGQGIEKDDLMLLFKPFKKTSTKSMAGEKSTGLGLFIVKRIVEAHNGKIWAESEKGKGTAFFVSFPVLY